ncbi:hypothetical protein GJ744_005793 [Endocarpon pusillum]|uniref:Uncharacterized protein n=1 Tax=Endocarpon pusillum TaxID=364733 RepID=A0A8H7DYK3_9EURO|nr:hypothetical protein GJ744_005793 [Endocarpon pusillum]
MAILVQFLFFAGLATSLAIRDSANTGGAASETCGFQGNSDIYGLGIRLGIYLQWISSCLSFHGRFNKRWSTGLVDVATIFEIALFIATLFLVADQGSTVYSVEIMLMTLIFFGDFYFVQVAAVLSYRNFSGMFSLAGMLLRLLLCLAMLSFSVWFWFPGFDRFQDTACGSYAFIFAKAPISAGGVRKFLQGLACIHLVVWTIPLSLPMITACGVVAMAFMIVLIEAMLTGRDGSDGRLGFFASAANFWQTPLEDLGGNDKTDDVADPWDSEKARRRRRGALFVLPFLIAFMIVTIELTLAFNSITGVYTIKSTGQLIPFIVGLGGIWTTVNDLVIDYYKAKTKAEEEMQADTRAAEEQTNGDARDEKHSATGTDLLINGEDMGIHSLPQNT